VPSASKGVLVTPDDFAGAELPNLVLWDFLIGDPENVIA